MRRLLAWLCAGLLTFAPALANAACTVAAPAFGTAVSLNNGFTTGSATLSNAGSTVTVTANDVVLIIFEIAAGGAQPAASTTVTDQLALAYTKRGSTTTWTCASGVTCTHEIWWAFAGATTGSDYAEVSVGAGSGVYSIGIARFTGVASGVTPFDANGQEPNISTNGTASTTQPAVTLTTTAAHDLLLSLCDGAGGGANSTNCQTAASGWSSALTGVYGGSAAWALYYKSVTAKQSSASYNVGGGVQDYWVDRGDALAGVDSCGVNGSLMMMDVGN